MAQAQMTDARELLKAGQLPEIADYISEEDAYDLARTAAVVTVHQMTRGDLTEGGFFYWKMKLEANGRIFLFDLANNERRDDLNEWLAVNSASLPMTGFVLKNGSKPGKTPFFYLAVAE